MKKIIFFKKWIFIISILYSGLLHSTPWSSLIQFNHLLPSDSLSEIDEKQSISKNKKMPSSIVYLGGAVNFPNLKSKPQLKNNLGYGVGADFFLGFLSFGNQSNLKKPRFDLGFSVAADFNQNFFSIENSNISPFPLINEVSTSLQKSGKSTSTTNQFKFGAGPQLNIVFPNGFIISPKINFGYNLNNSFDSISYTQNSTVLSPPQISFSRMIYSKKVEQLSGFYMQPGLRLHYFFGRIGVWTEVNYLYGSSTKTTEQFFIPEGGKPIHGDKYDYGQMTSTNDYQTKVTETKNHGMGIQAGICVGFGKPKPIKIPKSITPNPETPEVAQYIPPQNQICKECSLSIDSIKCNPASSTISLYLKVRWVDCMVPAGSINILALFNGTQIGSTFASVSGVSGVRNLTLNVPYSFGGSSIDLMSNVLVSDANCTSRISTVLPDCCKDCGYLKAINPTITYNSTYPGVDFAQLAGNLQTLNPSNPITKIVATLESIGVKNNSTPNPPKPNFEFNLQFSQIGGTTTGPSLSLNRSNLIRSTFSSPSTSINYSLRIDNMTQKQLHSERIKLQIFFQNGSYCEKLITKGNISNY